MKEDITKNIHAYVMSVHRTELELVFLFIKGRERDSHGYTQYIHSYLGFFNWFLTTPELYGPPPPNNLSTQSQSHPLKLKLYPPGFLNGQ